MARKKYSLFKRGDVIRTNPHEGFYSIAVVLDDGVKYAHWGIAAQTASLTRL